MGDVLKREQVVRTFSHPRSNFPGQFERLSIIRCDLLHIKRDTLPRQSQYLVMFLETLHSHWRR